MGNNLLTIVDLDGKEIWHDKFRFKWTHLDSFKEFAKDKNIILPFSSDSMAALTCASINYISILNIKVGYAIYLPESLSEKQINYLEENLPFLKEEEENDKIVDTAIYSREKVYYNHENYRDLKFEEKIDILEGRKKEEELVTQLLEEEINRQKEKTHKI